MKRFLTVLGAFLICALLVGCSKDTHEGLLSETINMMGQAATEVGVIKTAVRSAAKSVEDGNTSKLDFTKANAAADKLKQLGDKTQEIKRRIALVQSEISEEERKNYAENQKQKLNNAFLELVKAETDLRNELKAAERHNKTAVDELRKKIIEAISPFEAQARQ